MPLLRRLTALQFFVISVLAVVLLAAGAGRSSAPPESAAEVMQLQVAVNELESRVADLERTPPDDAAPRSKPADERWLARERWRRLRQGMSADEVRELFGEPSSVWASGNQTSWQYERRAFRNVGGEVTLRDGRVYGWREPDL